MKWYVARVTNPNPHLSVGFRAGQQVWVKPVDNDWFVYNGYRAYRLTTEACQASVATCRRRDGKPVVAWNQRNINTNFERRKK